MIDPRAIDAALASAYLAAAFPPFGPTGIISRAPFVEHLVKAVQEELRLFQVRLEDVPHELEWGWRLHQSGRCGMHGLWVGMPHAGPAFLALVRLAAQLFLAPAPMEWVTLRGRIQTYKVRGRDVLAQLARDATDYVLSMERFVSQCEGEDDVDEDLE